MDPVGLIDAQDITAAETGLYQINVVVAAVIITESGCDAFDSFCHYSRAGTDASR